MGNRIITTSVNSAAAHLASIGAWKSSQEWIDLKEMMMGKDALTEPEKRFIIKEK